MDNYILPFDCIKDRNVRNKTITSITSFLRLSRRRKMRSWEGDDLVLFSLSTAPGDVKVTSSCQA